MDNRECGWFGCHRPACEKFCAGLPPEYIEGVREMITGIAKNAFAHGHKVLFETNLFGKEYFWMQDGDGVVYLAHNFEGTPSIL